MTYVPRALQYVLPDVSKEFPALIVTGPRQSGKTTLLRQVSEPDRTYVTLDDLAVRELAREDPALFLRRYAPPVLIDEIQYAPELLPGIKILIDEGCPPGSFWLTGSQQFLLMKGITETLAGRIAVLQLLGFSNREGVSCEVDVPPFLPTLESYEARSAVTQDSTSVAEVMFRGAFPELVVNRERDRERFLESYLQTYLLRDVRELTKVGDLDAFHRFVRACAARTAQLLNLSDLARDVDVSVPTAKSWFSILVASFQVFVVRPYASNVTKRLIKAPKIYFADTGLAAYLTGWTSPQTLESGAMAGAFFETFVVTEILKSWLHRGRNPPLYYFRDKDQVEIDLLLELDGRLHPIEIKKSMSVRREWVKPFRRLERYGFSIGEGVVICMADQEIPIAEGLTAWPWRYV